MENHGENAEIETEIYSLNTIIYEGDLILDGYSTVKGATLKSGKLYEFGDVKDASDGTNYAENTVVLKVNGNLTVKEGVTLTSIKNGGAGGPKGMIVYCTETLKNDGDINMNGRGGYAEGQNIYLYKNSNEIYEFVPAIGASGGKRALSNITGLYVGSKGGDAKLRETGGGSGGSVHSRQIRDWWSGG